MSTQEPKRYPAVIFSPDKNTDYVYLNVTEAEAIEKFKAGEDWENLYEPAGYVPAPQLVETESFMLWRNQRSEIADRMQARGMPPELAQLVGRDPD